MKLSMGATRGVVAKIDRCLIYFTSIVQIEFHLNMQNKSFVFARPMPLLQRKDTKLAVSNI